LEGGKIGIRPEDLVLELGPRYHKKKWSEGCIYSDLNHRLNEYKLLYDAVPEDDFNYVSMVYHNTDSPGQLLALENEHWAPFIKSAMDAGKTTQQAWGNSRILSPSGPDMKATTLSYDLYSSLKEALDPTWSEDLQVPEGLAKINELEEGRRINYVYRIVKVVNANAED